MKDHLHTIGDRFAKLVIDEPDEDAAKRQEPDQIPEVFRLDSGTGIKSQSNAASTRPTRMPTATPAMARTKVSL
ncbi:MAG: hypothetical protein ACLU92_11200 [Coprococcus comes]